MEINSYTSLLFQQFPLPLYTMLFCGPNDNWRLLFWTTLFLGKGELFHGKWALDDKIVTAWFKEWQKFYDFLKKSTEFISTIVAPHTVQ